MLGTRYEDKLVKNTLGNANRGQVNLIRVIKKGGKSTMTGSAQQNITHEERTTK